ncbi:MAG: SDR family oxidoreductase [Chitinophagaceae bacterium]
MNILLTGANGFVGYYLCELLLQQAHQVTATGKGPCRLPFIHHPGFTYAEMDITQAATTGECIKKIKPEIIIHAAAMSKPNDCEANKEQARLVNVSGTAHLLTAAAAQQSFFLFLSTDFVFDGVKGMYKEDDIPGPVNYYGGTKLAAEDLVKEYPGGWSIIRTILVYGPPLPGRPNLLSIVKEKLERGEAYPAVDDQYRTPTYAGDLAKGIMNVAEQQQTGLFHIAGKDLLTPYEMACRAAVFLQRDPSLIRKVTAATFKEPAKRPSRTGFDLTKARTVLGYEPVSFETGLALTFAGQK